jgi:hypothetical protein
MAGGPEGGLDVRSTADAGAWVTAAPTAQLRSASPSNLAEALQRVQADRTPGYTPQWLLGQGPRACLGRGAATRCGRHPRGPGAVSGHTRRATGSSPSRRPALARTSALAPELPAPASLAHAPDVVLADVRVDTPGAAVRNLTERS